jgi:hypothetical protein
MIDAFLNTGDPGLLTGHLAEHSNLPGPRGNIELAQAFADAAASRAAASDVDPRCGAPASARLWALCLDMTAVSADGAPVNHPREFIPFCGAVGLGALGAVAEACGETALRALRALANDPRWRMREAVCFGLQRLLAAHPRQTVAALHTWVTGSWLELRAAAAAIAHPELLHDPDLARSALSLHQQIVDRVLQAPNRRDRGFRTLRQGLGYTLSVVVRAVPDEGFAWMTRLAGTGDTDVRWIVRQNLRKKRLTRSFPRRTVELARLVEDT